MVCYLLLILKVEKWQKVMLISFFHIVLRLVIWNSVWKVDLASPFTALRLLLEGIADKGTNGLLSERLRQFWQMRSTADWILLWMQLNKFAQYLWIGYKWGFEASHHSSGIMACNVTVWFWRECQFACSDYLVHSTDWQSTDR